MSKRFFFVLMVVVGVLLYSVAASAIEITILTYGSEVVPGLAELEAEKEALRKAALPHIEVKYEVIPDLQQFIDTLFVRILAGNAPDIIPGVMRWAPAFMEAGLAVDLEPFIEQTPWIDLDDWYPVSRDFGRYKGTLYTLPIHNLDVGITLFRKEALEAAGLESPYQLAMQGKWTWDTLEAMAKRLTMDLSGDGVPDQYGYYAWQLWEPAWASVIYSNGGEILTEDLTRSRLDEPAAYEALQRWYDLKNVHGVWGGAPWSLQNAGVISTGAIFHAQQISDAGFKVGIAPMPSWHEGQDPVHVLFSGGSMILDNGDPERIQAAWEVLAFDLHPDNRWMLLESLKLTGRLPAVRWFQNEWVSVYSEFADNPEVIFMALSNARTEPYNAYWPEMREIILQGLTSIWNNELTAQAAMSQVTRRIDAIMEQ